MVMDRGKARTPEFDLYRILGRLLHKSPTELREAGWGILMVSPWILGLCLFTLIPILACIYLSFTNFDILGTPKWVGLDNYIRALNLGAVIPALSRVPSDPLTYPAMGKTLLYGAITVPIGTLGSLFAAMLLNLNLRGTKTYRTLFYIPHLMPGIASVMLWKAILQPRVGIVNNMLRAVGLPTPGWYAEPKTALMTVVIMGLWGAIGGSRMLIFLAGLQGVPTELEEAAHLDGAGWWARFRHVVLPIISPTVLFNLILGVIGALQIFTLALAATAGGPGYATWFFALHIYQEGFQYFRMGYASALSIIFALVLLVFTWIQLRASKSWVFYLGGE
jgi:multiple sugar transport system permease protein